MSVVDKGFLVWLKSQDRNELLEHLDLPSRREPNMFQAPTMSQ
jgi:hypothetical protein